MEQIVKILSEMKNSSISNYAIAGLTSSLVGGESNGCVRLFEQERCQQDFITPHSHRFDFTCLVLAGEVTNRCWSETCEVMGDFFEETIITYCGNIGEHHRKIAGRNFYEYHDHTYQAGECYSMSHDQIHSIIFGKESKVLFFEGPTLQDTSLIIEPVVNGSVINTCLKKPWMFVKE